MAAWADSAFLRGSSLVVPLGGGTLGALLGLLIAWNPLYGIVMLFVIVFAPLAMVNLPLAVAVWMPLLFLEGLPGALFVPEAGAVVIAAAWLGEAIRPGSWQRQQLRRHRRLFSLAGLLVLWLAVTLVWAEEPGAGYILLVSSGQVVIFFGLIATIPSNTSQLRLIAGGFVAGAVLSAVIGIVGEAVGIASVDEAGRLQGSSGDPNFFAAQLVGGLAVACGLIVTTRRPPVRALLGISLLLLSYGIVGSQSRGGFAALLVIAVAALVAFREYRVQVVVLVAGIGAALGLWLSNDPGAWERITTAGEDRGSGREDLWTIAIRVSEDYPIGGVGFNNFPARAPEYTRQPGTLTGVIHIAREQEVHNAYLSLLAETGAVGLALFIGITGASLIAGARAARRFAEEGRQRAGILARAVAVGLAGMLAAAIFLTQSADKRIWVLMGLAAASLSVAERLPPRPGNRSA